MFNVVEDNFNEALNEWIEHCKNPRVRFSSFDEEVRDCNACRKIVSLGPKVLPLIRKLYDRDSSGNFELSIIQRHGLVEIVGQIVGSDFQIPEAIRGRISKMGNYTKNWLDENMSRYG